MGSGDDGLDEKDGLDEIEKDGLDEKTWLDERRMVGLGEGGLEERRMG